MSRGEGDNANTLETVHQFLCDVLDQVVRLAVENKADEVRSCVQQILYNAILEATRVAEETKGSDANVQDEIEDTQKEIDEQRLKVTSSERKPRENDVTSGSYTHNHWTDTTFSDAQARENDVTSGSYTNTHWTDTTFSDAQARENDVTSGSYTNTHWTDTTFSDAQAREKVITPGSYTNTHWTDTTFSDAQAFADRLESFTNKYGQLQAQSIRSLQAEYIESVAINKTDLKVRVRADELKDKVFPSFSKLKMKKTRYGKIKICFSGDLNRVEQKRIVKEAEELLECIKEREKAEKRKQRKEAGAESQGIGARIRRFFRSLRCWKSRSYECLL